MNKINKVKEFSIGFIIGFFFTINMFIAALFVVPVTQILVPQNNYLPLFLLMPIFILILLYIMKKFKKNEFLKIGIISELIMFAILVNSINLMNIKPINSLYFTVYRYIENILNFL